MKLFYALILSAFLSPVALFAQQDIDWNYYRSQVRNCASDDARCVGYRILDAMQDIHDGGGENGGAYTFSCSCGSEGMACIAKRNNQITQIEGKIAFVFSSDCQEAAQWAKRKGAFCAKGRSDNKYKLYAIDVQNRAYTELNSFTFESDCEDALQELKKR